jgi:hypothetical protein
MIRGGPKLKRDQERALRIQAWSIRAKLIELNSVVLEERPRLFYYGQHRARSNSAFLARARLESWGVEPHNTFLSHNDRRPLIAPGDRTDYESQIATPKKL